MTAEKYRTPEIDYLAKDFASFKQLMLDQLTVRVPDWRERNPSDVGQAILEVLSYAADQLSYYQDAVATEAYLGTARRVPSVRRHARLLDYQLHEGCNARWVHVEVRGELHLPSGTRMFTRLDRGSTGSVVSSTGEGYRTALGGNVQFFETMHAAELFEAHNEIPFFAGGVSEAYLRAGSTSATLKDFAPASTSHDLSHRRLRNLKVGDVLIFEQVCDPRSGAAASADRALRHTVRITALERTAFDRHELAAWMGGVCGASGGWEFPLKVHWNEADALPFDLPIAPVDLGGKKEDVGVARGNVLLADHGRTVAQERLPEIRPRQRYRPVLLQRGITHAVPYDHGAAQSGPATEAIRQDVLEALPCLRLFQLLPFAPLFSAGPEQRLVDEHGATMYQWTVRKDLLDSGPESRDLVVEVAGDGRAGLRFGFGPTGKLPLPGDRFVAEYRVGGGIDGNVGPDAIRHVVDTGAGWHNRIHNVRNPLPASGGRPRERAERVRLHAPHTLADPLSCVTAEDYTRQVLGFRSVVDAVAQVRPIGHQQVAMIYVRRENDRPCDPQFRRDLIDYLEEFRLVGTELEIRDPQFVFLRVAVAVTVEPDIHPDRVRRAVEAVAGPGTLPDGTPGFFHPRNFRFGGAVHPSRLIQTIMAVPGVADVAVTCFGRVGEAVERPEDAPAVPTDVAVGAVQIARLDNHPVHPGQGTLQVRCRTGVEA